MFWQIRWPRLPPRAVLVTFDDAYASVVESAAPLCRKFGVPAVFFVNAAFLDNQRLAPDNLVCYVANVLGMETINAAARAVRGAETPELHSLSEVFTSFFPLMSLAEREAFLEALRHLAGISERRWRRKRLYLTSKQLRDSGVFRFRDRKPHLQSCALQVSVAGGVRRRDRQE